MVTENSVTTVTAPWGQALCCAGVSPAHRALHHSETVSWTRLRTTVPVPEVVNFPHSID